MDRRPLAPLLSDGVVLVRRPAQTDLHAIVAACQDPLITRFTRIPSPYTEDDGRAYLELAEEGWSTGVDLPLVVVDAASQELLGAVGLHGIDWCDGVAEIGYWVAARARGRGVATRAVALVSRWALAELGLARLELTADVANAPSLRVAERAGYVREGILRSRLLLAGERRDAVLFSLVAADLGRLTE